MGETYYRSSHPDALAFWGELKRRQSAYEADCKALMAEFSAESLIVHTFGGEEWIGGLDANASPGPLWQKRSGQDYWTPRLRTAEGKALQERLHSIAFRRPRLPGMVSGLYVRGGKTYPGILFRNGIVWVEWDADAERVEKEHFDPAIWQRAKASEYWLAREQAEQCS